MEKYKPIEKIVTNGVTDILRNNNGRVSVSFNTTLLTDLKTENNLLKQKISILSKRCQRLRNENKKLRSFKNQ